MEKREDMSSGGIGRPGGGGGPRAMASAFAGEKAKNAKQTLKRLSGYFLGFQREIIAVILAVAVTSLITALMPMVLGNATNVVKESIGQGFPEQFLTLIIAYGVMVLLNTLFQLIQGLLMAKISQHTVYSIRKALFHKLQTLSLRFFDTHERGDTMSRLTNDVETISNTLSQNATTMLSGVLTVLITTLVMFVYNWRLAFVAIIPLPFITLLTKRVAKNSRKYFLKQQRSMGAINGLIEETITALPVVKIFCGEKQETEKFNIRNQAFRKNAIIAQVLTGVMMPIMGMINNIGFALLAAIGGIFVINELATVGAVLAFFFYAKNFGRPISQLAQSFAQIQSALAGAERIFEILDETVEVKDDENATELTDVKGEVVFNDVAFSYVPNVPILHDINLTAKPGDTIAFVGPTGAGKTTIINLLTRFYDIQHGEITIDGKDIKKVTKDSLREQLGIVLQDTYLFKGTVKDNILYGRLDATDEEVKQAAKLANADKFIHRLPEKYDTELGSEGGNLSEGQRQLIAIARAILADPKILILDEATSNVDTRTEIHIQEALLELMKGRTSFVIAHRLSTIKNADCIMVINGGTIVERGTHEALIQAKGFYYQLYNSQFEAEENLA
jgi:ATP-binding cassette subfamily B protein